MDVAFGHCWRCENPITREVKCPQCGVAKYCSDTCCRRDQYRHKPECEEWRPKRCNNPKCTNSHQPLKECSSCNNASYCSQDCIKAHWKDHKHMCRERAQEIRMKAASLQGNFQKRCGNPLTAPYYFGNALAIDMLNLRANECNENRKPGDKDPLERDYNILSAGCGNLRNWIHTVASLPDGFSGNLHTILNDFDPFVQARNVLQLYMMSRYPDNDNIATTITNIWYSLKLSEHDYQLLFECLTALKDLTAAELVEGSGGVILLMEAEMAPMREVWQSWLILECRKGHPNYIDLHKQRQEVFERDPGAADGIDVYRKELPSEFVPSYNDYMATGIFHPRGSKTRDLQYDNPTLTGYNFPRVSFVRRHESEIQEILAAPKKLEFVYCIVADLNPFGSWDYLKAKKKYYHKSMTVMFHRYIRDQIEQAIKWVHTGRVTVSFVVWNCLELTARLNPDKCKFDRIFTSNIADYSGTQPLLRAMKSYLNLDSKCSVIVTQYWNWYGLFPDARITAPESGLDGRRSGHVFECLMAATKDINIDTKESALNNPSFVTKESMKVMTLGTCFFQEYFNYMIYFVSYLRAELLAFTDSLEDVSDEFRNVLQMQDMFDHLGIGHESACIPKHSGRATGAASAGTKPPPPPSFQKVKQSEGLKLRDFRRGELNRVVPFQYRRNVRRVNHSRGLSRMLEWGVP